MQWSDSKTDVCNGGSAMKHAIGELNAEDRSSPWYAHGTGERMITHEYESEYDSNEDSGEGFRPGI